MLNFMVKYQDALLDRTFAALADPTRRALLAQLSDGESASVSKLARPFPMSLPAVMKHLDVLSDAGLIRRNKTGRIVACELTPEPMETAMNWLNRYLRFWSEQPNHLAAFKRVMSAQAKVAPKPSLTLKRCLNASPERVLRRVDGT